MSEPNYNTSTLEIVLNLSSAFKNKTLLTGRAADNAASFIQRKVTPADLAAHIAAGRAWTLGAFAHDYRTKENWQSSQVIALDLDSCPLTAAEVARLPGVAENAYLVHPSATSSDQQPKTRVVFILPEAVTTRSRWTVIQAALVTAFADLKPDHTTDLARMFYGSDRAGHIVLGNVTNWTWIQSLLQPVAAAEYASLIAAQTTPARPLTGQRGLKRAEAYAATALENFLIEVQNAQPGSRNATLYKVAARMQSRALGGWPGFDEAGIRQALERVWQAWPNHEKSRETVERGFADARPVALPSLPDRPRPTDRPAGVGSPQGESESDRAGLYNEGQAGCPTASESDHDQQAQAAYTDRDQKRAAAAVQKALTTLTAAQPGSRNATLYKVAIYLQSRALGGWPNLDTAGIRQALEAIYQGWQDTNPDRSRATMERAFAAAKPVWFTRKNGQINEIRLPKAAELPTFTADRVINARYVADADQRVFGDESIALKSPTGSGKSVWAAQICATPKNGRLPSVLIVSFRQALAKSLAAQFDALAYDEMTDIDSSLIAAADRVSTTIDSLYRFAGRKYDVVVIDELVSLVSHYSSAGTMKEKAPESWRVLCEIVQAAGRVITADANLTDYALTEFQALRYFLQVENTYIHPKPETLILPDPIAFYASVLDRVTNASLPVLVGVTTPREARLIRDLIAARQPAKRVRVITSKQSHLTETQTFIRQINDRLAAGDCDVLVFNGAMSTGVSVTAAVDSIVCLINSPLAPADAVQMLGRARNTPARFAYLPGSAGSQPADATATKLAAERWSELETATGLAQVTPSRDVMELGRIHARHEGQRRLEMSQFLPYFRAYCAADGSATSPVAVAYNEGLHDQIRGILKGYKADQRAAVLDTDRVPTITPDMLDAIRQAGIQEITPDIDAGSLRHKIENATGLPVDEHLYDTYKTRQARSNLFRADIATSDRERASDIDSRDNDNDTPLHQRSNAAAIRALWRAGLHYLGATGLTDLPNVISKVDAGFFEEFGKWAAARLPEFKAVLGWRDNHDADLTDPTATGLAAARFFLRRFGLRLIAQRKMTDHERVYLYSVTADDVEALAQVIAARRLAADRAAQESAKKPVTQKRQNTVRLPFLGNPLNRLKKPDRPAAGQRPAGAGTGLNPFSSLQRAASPV